MAAPSQWARVPLLGGFLYAVAMTEEEDSIPVSRDVLENLIRLTLRCTTVIADKARPVETGDSADVERVSGTILYMAAISANSLLTLTEEANLSVRDCFPIARSIVESAINAAFILAKGPEAADRAIRHARQKSYRDLARSWNVGNTAIEMRWTGEVPPDERAELEALVAEFTDARGREMDWSDESLRQKLVVIEENFSSDAALLLNGAAFLIYRVASEVTHGSYFGALFFWGMTRPRRRSARRDEDRLIVLNNHRGEVLAAAIHALAAALECFADHLGDSDLKNDAAACFKSLLRSREIAAAADDDSSQR